MKDKYEIKTIKETITAEGVTQYEALESLRFKYRRFKKYHSGRLSCSDVYDVTYDDCNSYVKSSGVFVSSRVAIFRYWYG